MKINIRILQITIMEHTYYVSIEKSIIIIKVMFMKKNSYELSSQSWKLIGPIWLSATKFGNVSPNKTIVAFKRYFQILLLLYFRYRKQNHVIMLHMYKNLNITND